MTIKEIAVYNLQSIKGNYSFTLPETGIIKFCAQDNNSGKSIVIKTLNEIIKGNLHKPSTRLPLINFDASFASMKITLYNDDSLKIVIAKEAKNTYAELCKKGQEPVTRYLSDKAFDELIVEFGFHFEPKSEISLNLYNTFDPLVFVTTPQSVNCAVLDTAAVDYRCDTAIENMTKTLKEIKRCYDETVMKKTNADCLYIQLITYDAEELAIKKKKAETLAAKIASLPAPFLMEKIVSYDMSKLKILNLERLALTSVMNFNLVDNTKLVNTVNKIKILESLNLDDPTDFESLMQTWQDTYTALINERCPICNSKLYKEGEK